jgi:preprotein translocase subunit SecB
MAAPPEHCSKPRHGDVERVRSDRGRRVLWEKIMAQEATGNGPSLPQPSGPGASLPPQQLIISAQYIKDLSFENPRAPASLRQQTSQPAVEINVDVRAQSLGLENYEVVLTIKANAKTQNEIMFIIELAYGAIVTVRNLPPESIGSIVLVETPRLIFPFARNIIAETTRDGGFPPLMINPIDFAELLRRNAATPAGDPPPASATA